MVCDARGGGVDRSSCCRSCSVRGRCSGDDGYARRASPSARLGRHRFGAGRLRLLVQPEIAGGCRTGGESAVRTAACAAGSNGNEKRFGPAGGMRSTDCVRPQLRSACHREFWGMGHCHCPHQGGCRQSCDCGMQRAVADGALQVGGECLFGGVSALKAICDTQRTLTFRQSCRTGA